MTKRSTLVKPTIEQMAAAVEFAARERLNSAVRLPWKDAKVAKAVEDGAEVLRHAAQVLRQLAQPANTDMVKRVAQALSRHCFDGCEDNGEIGPCVDPPCPCREAARAAIQAMMGLEREQMASACDRGAASLLHIAERFPEAVRDQDTFRQTVEAIQAAARVFRARAAGSLVIDSMLLPWPSDDEPGRVVPT